MQKATEKRSFITYETKKYALKPVPKKQPKKQGVNSESGSAKQRAAISAKCESSRILAEKVNVEQPGITLNSSQESIGASPEKETYLSKAVNIASPEPSRLSEPCSEKSSLRTSPCGLRFPDAKRSSLKKDEVEYRGETPSKTPETRSIFGSIISSNPEKYALKRPPKKHRTKQKEKDQTGFLKRRPLGATPRSSTSRTSCIKSTPYSSGKSIERRKESQFSERVDAASPQPSRSSEPCAENSPVRTSTYGLRFPDITRSPSNKRQIEQQRNRERFEQKRSKVAAKLASASHHQIGGSQDRILSKAERQQILGYQSLDKDSLKSLCIKIDTRLSLSLPDNFDKEINTLKRVYPVLAQHLLLLVIQPLREQVGEKILYTQDAVADWPDEELACSIKETLEELKECGEVFSYVSEDGSARLLSDILKSEFYLAIQNGSAIDSEEQEEEGLENQFKIHLREVISRFELAISKCNTEQLVGFCNYFRNSRDSIEMEDEAKRLISESFESLVFQELDKRQTAEVPTTLTETIVASEN